MVAQVAHSIYRVTRRPLRLLAFAIFNTLLTAHVIVLLWLGWRPDALVCGGVLAVVIGLGAFMAWALEYGWGETKRVREGDP